MQSANHVVDATRRAVQRWLIIAACGIEGVALAAPFVPVRDAHCVAMSPDGQRVAIGYSGQSHGEFPPRPHPSPRKAAVVQIFDLATRKRLRRMETFGDLTRLEFSADGAYLAVSRLFVTDDGIELNEVRVWDVASGQPRHVFDRCQAFSFAPDRSEIVVASRLRCIAYDLATDDKRQQIPSLAAALCLNHFPDGSRVLGIVPVASGFVLRAGSVSDGGLLHESQPLPEPFYSLAVPRSAIGLATGHANGQVLVWDPLSLNPVAQWRTGGTGRAFPFYSPNGELLAAADQRNSDVVIWETESGQERARYTYQQGALHTFGPKSASRTIRPEEDPARFTFSPGGDAFLGGPYGGILRLVANGRDIGRFGE